MSFTNPIVENPYPYAYAITATSPNTLYEAVESLVPGIYTITFSGGGTLNVDFYSGTTYIGTATSSSSPFLYNLGTQATNFKFWCTTSSNIVISLTALALSEISGTVYTFTTSQTVNLTGDAYVLLVGGGGAGSASASGSTGNNGGGSGGIVTSRLTLTGSTNLTIGTGGIGRFQIDGTSGGTSTFASLTATGGASGGTGGIGGTPGGGNGGIGGASSFTAATASINTNLTFSFFTQGTTGGGGASSLSTPGAGSGSGLGTGGEGFPNANGGSGTGYGSGGGAGGLGYTGGNGAPGLCVIII